VLHGWPGYLAYLVSFLTIGVSWLLHTAMTDHLAGTDQLFLRLNLLLLLVVVVLPFPTGLIADAMRHDDVSGGRVYVTMYGLTLLAITLLGSALDAYARHEHLYSPATEGEELHRDRRKQGRAPYWAAHCAACFPPPVTAPSEQSQPGALARGGPCRMVSRPGPLPVART